MYLRTVIVDESFHLHGIHRTVKSLHRISLYIPAYCSSVKSGKNRVKKHIPQRNHKLIPLQHPQLQPRPPITKIAHPHAPLPPLPHRLPRTPPPAPPTLIHPAPDILHRPPIAFERDPLDGDAAFVLRARGAELADGEAEEAGEVREGVLRVAVRFLEGEVDVGGVG